MSVKGPELVNMYIGQSEKNIRDVFARFHQKKKKKGGVGFGVK